jgi:hypothetical protein
MSLFLNTILDGVKFYAVIFGLMVAPGIISLQILRRVDRRRGRNRRK